MFFKLSKVSLGIWIGAACVMMTICLILVITLANQASRVVVLAQLFPKDTMRFGQFVEATDMGARLPERHLIDEMLIRFYVENRHFYIPDGAELSYRYGGMGPVARLSQPSVASAFMRSKGNYLENIQNATGTTSVDITRLDRRDNTFTVDFDIYMYDDGRKSFGGSRRATIRVGYNPAFIRFFKDFANPYGLFVEYYDEKGLKKR